MPLAAPAARALGLTDGEVVEALVQTRPNGDMALLLRGRMLELPRPSPWTEGEKLSLRVQGSPSGPWSLQLLPATTALPSLTTAPDASVFFSKVANLLFRPPLAQGVAEMFRPGTLDAILQGLPRPDLQAQWRSMQLSMAQLTPQALSPAGEDLLRGDRISGPAVIEEASATTLVGPGDVLQIVEHQIVRRVVGLADFLDDDAPLALQFRRLEG